MQPLSFFFDDTIPLRLSEQHPQFFLLTGGTAALKERLLQAVSKAGIQQVQQQFYHANALCGLFFPNLHLVFFDADRFTVLPRLGCPELDTYSISLHDCYSSQILQNHAEAIRYSYAELQENEEHALLLQSAAEQAFSHFCSLTESAVSPEQLPKHTLPRHAVEHGTLELRQLQGCTPEGVLMQPLPADWNTTVLLDPWYTAGSNFLEQLSMEAIQKGYHAILCTHPLQLELPVQLLLPERKQAYILQGSLFGEQFPECDTCSLQDCYPEHALQAQLVQMQLTAALLQNNMKAYTGMLRVAQGVRTVMQQILSGGGETHSNSKTIGTAALCVPSGRNEPFNLLIFCKSYRYFSAKLKWFPVFLADFSDATQKNFFAVFLKKSLKNRKSTEISLLFYQKNFFEKIEKRG